MDAREIEKCIDDFGTDIYRFCLKLCADKEDAEDLYLIPALGRQRQANF